MGLEEQKKECNNEPVRPSIEDINESDVSGVTYGKEDSTIKIFLKNLVKLPFRLVGTFLEGCSFSIVCFTVLLVIVIILSFIGGLLLAIWALIGSTLGAIAFLVAAILLIIPVICVISDLADYKWFKTEQRKMFIHHIVTEVKKEDKE